MPSSSSTETKPSVYECVCSFVFGPPVTKNLPERIALSLEEQQSQSEKLVSWIQLSLVCTFGVLYALSQKMSAPGAIQMVPLALGLYFAFTVVRLIIAHRSRLSPWMLTASVVMDMGLLMSLIWSFHIQYDQPASFYLKAPTLLYVFIFIALRALRLDYKYVLVAGGTAMVGWLVLMGYVMLVDKNNPMITNNYVDYMTSNSILIGAEIDKLISIALVTIVLAIALHRGEKMMRRAALGENAAQDLSRFVPQEVAEHLTGSDKQIKAGDGESKVATVLFTDIEGFSTISERVKPEELVATLNDYFGVMYELVKAHGGMISQYQGDAMLITFNGVNNCQGHAAMAIRTALAIREITLNQTFGDSISMKTRSGINTGEMTIGAVGAEERLIFTVFGDDVNVAARLEQLNKEYGSYIMVSEQCREAAGDEFSYEHAGDIVVRGRSTPTAVYKVI